MATCYQKLKMLDECTEYLDKAIQALKQRITILEQQEQNILF